MPESEDAKPSARRILTGLILTVVSAAVLLAVLQGATEGLYGYDGYFHVRYAQVLRSQGVSRTFPWWQETFLRDHFADKEFLYHVLLIPFTFGDLVLGGKIAAVVFGSAVAGVFFLVALRLRVPWPEAWTFLLLSGSTAFLYRLGFTRPLVLAVALSLAGTCAILLERERWAFAFAAIYPHVHISFHLLPCVALLHDFHRGRDASGRIGSRVARWTCGGAILGALLSPYVPNNLYLWWIQNVRVLGMAWIGPEDLRLGQEIQAGRSDDLLKYDLGVFAALAAAVYLIARRRRRASPQVMTLLVISSGFLALSMMSRRFVEFWTPFTILLAAVATRDALKARKRESEAARARPRWALAAFLAAAGAALLWHTATQARGFVAQDEGLYYAGASEWMGANIPPGETIFHLDWDDFPQLFYFNPQFRYLVGLDPTFMYLTDSARWKLWSDVAHDNVDDIYAPIRETFRSRWVFAIPEAEDFLKAARRDPRFFVRYEDTHASVLFLADGYSFMTDWRLTGWYPDPARRLLDVPVGPEPGAQEAAVPVASGPGAHGLSVHAGSGWVDLEQRLGLVPWVEDACAVAESALVTERAEAVTLGMTTDDAFRITVNGEPVLEYSPFRGPESGDQGILPPTLDEFLESRAHVPERTARVTIHAGSNPVLVKTCRVKEDFGFFLRAYRDDGSVVAGASPARGDAGEAGDSR